MNNQIIDNTTMRPECLDGGMLLEFPILRNGLQYVGGRNAQPGEDRVVFQYDQGPPGGPATFLYCGMMVHRGVSTAGFLPFEDCTS